MKHVVLNHFIDCNKEFWENCRLFPSTDYIWNESNWHDSSRQTAMACLKFHSVNVSTATLPKLYSSFCYWIAWNTSPRLLHLACVQTDSIPLPYIHSSPITPGPRNSEVVRARRGGCDRPVCAGQRVGPSEGSVWSRTCRADRRPCSCCETRFFRIHHICSLFFLIKMAYWKEILKFFQLKHSDKICIQIWRGSKNADRMIVIKSCIRPNVVQVRCFYFCAVYCNVVYGDKRSC